MREELKKIIEKAIKGYIDEPINFSVEIQSEKTYGDYSTNVALIISKRINKNPIETANLIKDKIGNNKIFKKIEVASPGFINFFIADKFFIDNLKNIDKNYGKGKELKNKKIIIEYTDPNPFKEFHIGHLMSNAIGESLSRIFEFQEAKIKRACYQGDVGLHVAKAVFGMREMEKNESFPKESDSLTAKIKLLNMAYVNGTEQYENNDSVKKIINDLNKSIFERSNNEINNLYDKGKKWSLEYFNKIYKELGTKFDYFIFESQTGNIGKKIIEKGLKDGIFEKGDNGAVIFKGEKYGLHTRVFINSEGLPTYEAKDLGNAEIKYKKYKYDKSVIITGNEVNDYFKVVLCAMNKINPILSDKTKHIGHGMLRLPEGKMSSRTGKVITAESLIERVKELVKEKIKDREFSDKENKEIIENVAIGAIKYSILKQSIGSDIIYDFDKSISFEGDSGPYLQYSYTRAVSVLRKAKIEKIKSSFKKFSAEVTQLEKSISYFPDIVLKAEKEYEPHFLVLYLTELAGLFNSYYAKNKIVDRLDEYSPYKIALTEAFTIVMRNGLWMLGIKTLEKM